MSFPDTTDPGTPTGHVLTMEVRDHVLLVGLNKPSRRNAFDLVMLRELAEAYTRCEHDPDLRCLLLFAHGEHFTGGLDLARVGPAIFAGVELFPRGVIDPLGISGARISKPVVIAVQGWCLTIGVELLLASDIRLAAKGTRFGQMEVQRGILPFGGGTWRWPAQVGWGNAMRWMLTGDATDADEALRIGLIQEVTEPERLFDRAFELAAGVAAQAPLAVQAILRNARLAEDLGPGASARAVVEEARALMTTEDATEGLRSFMERRRAVFTGK
jgi:enoyl-CoA hydratase